MEIWIPCVPPKTSHHSKKIVNIRLRDGRSFSKLADSPELRNTVAFWTAALTPYAPRIPVLPPTAVAVDFVWPWRKSDGKAIRARGLIPCSVRPDLSNVWKTLEDCLVRLGFVRDDGEITRVILGKYLGDHPGVRIRIEPHVMVRREYAAGDTPLFEGVG